MEAGALVGERVEREQSPMERAHQELCTALTALRSNVELVRIELRPGRAPDTREMVAAHLSELDRAVDRLERLAHDMRSWHAARDT